MYLEELRIAEATPTETVAEPLHEISSKLEIIPLLLAMLRERTQLGMYYGEAKNFVLTTIRDLDPARGSLTLACAEGAQNFKGASPADSLLFLARQGGVKLQFMASGLEANSVEGELILNVSLPDHLLSFDRRRYYRMAVPVADGVHCLIPTNTPGKHLQFPIADISSGGLAFVSHPTALDTTPGKIHFDCQLVLGEVGALVVNLAVRNTFEVAPDSGNKDVRVGCQFVDLSSSGLLIVQRYIARVELERADRLPSLDFVE